MRYWAAIAVGVIMSGILVGLEFTFLPWHTAEYLVVGALTIGLFALLFRRRKVSRDPVDEAELHAGDAAGLTHGTGTPRPRPL